MIQKNTYKKSLASIKRLMEKKDKLSLEQKKKLLLGLKILKNKISAEEISPIEPMRLESIENQEREVIANEFEVDEDFDSYVTKNRGIQFSTKEIDTIQNFKEIKTPSTFDRFMIKYEDSDEFGNNKKTVIKKHLDGKNALAFVSYSTFSNIYPSGPEESPKEKIPTVPSPSPKLNKQPGNKSPSNKKQSNNLPNDLLNLKEKVENSKKILVRKTIPFQNETNGADILADFLRKIL